MQTSPPRTSPSSSPPANAADIEHTLAKSPSDVGQVFDMGQTAPGVSISSSNAYAPANANPGPSKSAPPSPSIGKRKRSSDETTEPEMASTALPISAVPGAQENETEFIPYNERWFAPRVARDCGHVVHPRHTQYTSALCPVCTMTERMDALRDAMARVAQRGGIVSSKANGYAGHTEILRGYTDNHMQRHRRRSGQLNPKEIELKAQSWRGSRLALANCVDVYKTGSENEMKWEAERSIEFAEGDKPKWLQYSMTEALKIFEEVQEEILYVAGDPVGISNRTPVDPVVLKQEKEAADGRSERRKRRKISNVSFKEAVIVSPFHDIDEGKHVTIWSRLPFKLNKPAPAPRPTVRLLNDKPSRSQSNYHRKRPNSKGHWKSPEGYEKADTSWATVDWNAKDRLERREQQQINAIETPQWSVAGAVVVGGCVGASVGMLKWYLIS
jgi:hypothetical protein